MNSLLQVDAAANLAPQLFNRVLQNVARRTEQRGHLRSPDADVREEMLRASEGLLVALCEGASLSIDREEPPACAHCRQPMVFKQNRDFILRSTLTGEPANVPSPYFFCENCHKGCLVLRDALGVNRDGMTESLAAKVGFAGTVEPYEPASSTLLRELAGVNVSGTKVHSVCQQFGAMAESLIERGQAADVRRVAPNETVYVMVDGSMLHMDGDWHEVKVAIIFAGSDRVAVSKHRAELVKRQGLVTRGTREVLGPMIYEALRSWLPLNRWGEPAIRGRVSPHRMVYL